MARWHFVAIVFGMALATLLVGFQPVAEAGSEEANKEVIRRFIKDVKNRANPASASEILAQDYVHHFHMPGQELPPGIAGSMKVGEIFGKAFPEIKVVNKVLIAEGDYVMERSEVEALHGGEFAGVPATNKTVRWTENHLYRLVDGRIAEHWPEANMLGVLVQIGAIE